MNDQEILESKGQMTIFEYVEHIPDDRKKVFVQGEMVKLRLYIDEVDYVTKYHAHLLEFGRVKENHGSYYSVEYSNCQVLKIDAEKLIGE